jgi:AcrR family transcriptional regulator
MNPKKQQIIETAIRFFAQKGYHATSIQEIVDELGIAKGSLYLHFKSKEDLLLSIYKYYVDLFLSKMYGSDEEEGLSPKERLSKKVLEQFKFLIEHRDFLIMQMQDNPIPINRELKEILFDFRAKIMYWQQKQIISIYGEEAKPYSLDGSTMFTSMVQSYLSYIMFDGQNFDLEELSNFIVDRLDDVMTGMMSKKPIPILKEQMLNEYLDIREKTLKNYGILQEIHEMRNIVSQLEQDYNDLTLLEEVLSTLTILEEEFKKENPKQLIIKGMLVYLKGLNIPELNQYLARIQAKMDTF